MVTEAMSYPETHTSSHVLVNRTAATIALWTAILTIVALALLHILSPEFDPSWRMVSEYSLGKNSWLLSLMFLSWAVSTFALYFAIRKSVNTRWGKIGLIFLLISGVGQAMAAFFDVMHPLHGMAAMLGMPCFAIGAMMISYSIARNPSWSAESKTLKIVAHLTWISIVIFSISVIMFMGAITSAGVTPGKPLERLPEGVSTVVGWVNRLFVLVYCLYTIVVARIASGKSS